MRNILITGASSGLGMALALQFSGEGRILHLTGRNSHRLEQVKKLCAEKKAIVHTKILDVRDKNKMKNYIENLCIEHNLDVIIANAGISAGTAGIFEPNDQVYEIFETNIMGVLNTIQPAIPYFCERKRGKILIVSSLAGYVALPSCPAYSASKAAVRFYGNALADSLRKYNVDVMVTSPGYIATPMTEVNDFKMPFKMEASDAAKLIYLKLKNANSPNIAFPWVMYFFTWFTGILHRKYVSFILRLLPSKKSMIPNKI